MAPDTGMQAFVNASTASMSLPTIPRSPRTLRDMTLDEELIDPDSKLILSDFTQITEYFPMDLYRSMFFINTLDHDYNRALDEFDTLARKLQDTSLPQDTVLKIKSDMSRNLNLMMANRNETLAEAARLYETADHAFNILDNSITVAEENLQNPPSTTYFLPSPPPEEEIEEVINLSDVSSSADDDAASVKTDDLTSAHLQESELKALRRRMKKSFQWFPTPSCIKKELQSNGRWPLQAVDKAARHHRKMAKLKRKRQRLAQKQRRDHALATRKAAAQSRVEKKKQSLKTEAKVRYTMPVAADEPTYCYCGDVSYGEMIACENEFCSREWFHLDCVGLAAAPKGKWYCHDCDPRRSNSVGPGRKRKRV